MCRVFLISTLVALSLFSSGSLAEEAALQTGDPADASRAAFARLQAFLTSNPLDFKTTFVATSDTLGTRRGEAHFLIKHPNMFRIEGHAAQSTYVIVSDGQTMTILMPKERKYAQIAAPRSARDGLGLVTGLMSVQSQVLNFIGLIEDVAARGENYKVTANKTATIGTRQCERFTVVEATPAVTDRWEVWLEASDQALPCKFETQSSDDLDNATQTNEFTWKQNPAFPQDAFVFVPPAGAVKVGVDGLDLGPPG